jgi:hypothetical protein
MAAKPDARNLSPDEFVEARVPDPAQHHADHRVIKGWFGKSAHPGHWRLYTTPELNSYVEIAEDDILLRRPVETSVSPLGGTILVIKSTAEIRGMGTTTVVARDALLHGDITTEMLGKAGPDIQSFMIGVGLGDKSYTEGFWCDVSMLFSCTTHVVDDDVCTLASGKMCGTVRFLP